MSTPANTINRFRTLWANRFVDTITVTRMTGRGTFNATTLVYDTETESTPYTGEALIRPFTGKGTTVLFGGEQLTGKEYAILVPYDAGEFQPEDLITIDTCTYDPHLVDATMRVLSEQHDSYLTRIELICRFEEGTGYA